MLVDVIQSSRHPFFPTLSHVAYMQDKMDLHYSLSSSFDSCVKFSISTRENRDSRNCINEKETETRVPLLPFVHIYIFTFKYEEWKEARWNSMLLQYYSAAMTLILSRSLYLENIFIAQKTSFPGALVRPEFQSCDKKRRRKVVCVSIESIFVTLLLLLLLLLRISII